MSNLVIRTPDPDRLKAFFEELGLAFASEKHGRGPEHYAHQKGNQVFEIYPSTKTDSVRFIDTPPTAE